MRVVAQYLAAVAAILVMSAVTTAANPPEGVCRATPIPNVQDYVVDARENNSAAGRTRYRQKEQVRMVLVNRNPYLYEYRVSIEASPVSGPSPADFLALFGVSFSSADPTPAAVQPAASSVAPLMPGAFCSLTGRLDSAGAELVTAFGELVKAWTPAKALVTEKQAALETVTPRFKDPQAACESLYEASTTFVSAVKDFTFTPKPVQDALDRFRARTAALEADVLAAEKDAACTSQAARYRFVVDGAKTEADKLAANLEGAVKTTREIEAARSTVQAVLRNPESFTQTEWIPDSMEPTDVTIIVSRRELKPDALFAKMFEKRLNFGGRALFAVSGGWATAWLRKVEYAAVDGQPRAADNTPVGDPSLIVPVVGTTEDSSKRSGPVILGHLRLHQFIGGGPALHVSLGVSPQSDGGTVEVFMGPSLSFANEMGFVTLGAYRGHQRRLEGSYHVGKPLPEGTTAIPTALDEHWRFGFSLSFRLR